MAVIKGQNAAGLLKEAIVLDLGDLGRQAAKIQAAADARARKTIADAEHEAARLVEGAHAKGFEKGMAEGLAKGTAQGLEEGRKKGRAEALAQSAAALQKLQQAWAAAALDWDSRREALEREARESALDLALTLSEKLVHRVIEVDRTVVVDQVGNALGHVLRAQDVSIRIAPQDRPMLQEAMPQLVAEFAHLKHIHIVDDPAVGPGGCVVVYGQGQIDATIDNQLRRVVEFMLPGEPADDAHADDPAPSASGPAEAPPSAPPPASGGAAGVAGPPSAPKAP